MPDQPGPNQYRPDPLDEAPAEIQQKIGDLRARLADRETKLATMRKTIREAGVKLNMYKASAAGALDSPEAKKQTRKAIAILKEREERVQHIKKVYRRLLHSKEQAEHDFAEEVETYKDTITKLRAQIDVQVDTRQALQQQETQAETERHQLLAESTERIERLEAQIAEHNAAQTQWRDQQRQLTQELEQLGRERDDLQRHIESRQEEQAGRSTKQDTLIQQRDQKIEQQATLLRKMQETGSLLEKRISEREANHQTEIETLSRQLERVQDQLKEKTAGIEDRDQQIEQVASAKDQLEQQEQQLTQELEQLRTEREELQKQVETLKKPKRGRPSTQAKRIKEHEKTIAEQAEALKELEPLHTERDDLLKQLESLKKPKRGRPSAQAKLLKEREETIEQQAQTLKALEQAKAELAEQISQRESEHQAELDALAEQLQQVQEKLKAQSAAIEQRDQTLEQQAQALKALEQTETDLTERLSQLQSGHRAERDTLTAQLQQVQDELKEQTAAVEQRDQAIEQQAESVKKLEQADADLTEQIRELTSDHQTELDALAEQLRQVQDELKEQSASVEQRDTQIEALQDAESELRQNEERLQQDLEQIRADNADLQQQLEKHQANYERSIVEQTQLLQARDRLLEQREKIITEKAAALAKLEQSSAPLREEVTRQEAEVGKLTEQLQDTETRLEARLAVIQARDRELAEARQALEQTETKLQAKIARWESKHVAETDRLASQLEQAQDELEQQKAAVEQRTLDIEHHLATQKQLEDQAAELETQLKALTAAHQDETAALSEQIKQTEVQLATQIDALAKRDERIRELSAAEKELRQSREAVEMQIVEVTQELQGELKKQQKQLADKDDALKQQRAETAQQGADRKELRKSRDHLSTQLADLQREHQIILEALQDKTAQLNAAEHRLYEERSRLQTELDDKASTSDASIGQLQQKLEALHDKEQELDQQARQFAEERDSAVTALTEARQQLQGHRKEMQAVKSRLTGDQRDRVELLQQIDDLNEALTEAKRTASAKAKRPGGPVGRPAIAAPPSTRRPRLLATAASIALLLTSAGLTTAILTGQPSGSRDAVAWIKVTDGDSAAIQSCAGAIEKLRLDLGADDVDTHVDKANRIVEMRIDQPSDPKAACDTLDTFGHEIVTQFQPKTGRVTAADRAAIESAMEDDVAFIRKGFASLISQEEDKPGHNHRTLLASWNQALNRRQDLTESLARLSTDASHELPSEHAMPVDRDRRKEAEQADAALQADIAEIEQRETRLTELLLQTLDNGTAHFLALRRAATEGDAYLKEMLTEGHGEEVDEHIETLQESLADWGVAADMLREAWSAASKDLASDADPLSVRDILAPAVRAFALTTQISFEQFRLALESIDQGGDQPTTRVVLKKNLTLRLDPVVEARNEVVFAGRSILLEDNLELNATVQSLTGLRTRVDDRRVQIAQSLRREALDKMAEQHRERQADSERRRQELMGQLAEVDQQITQMAKQLQTVLQQDDTTPSEQRDQIAAISARFGAFIEKALQEYRPKTRGAPLELAYFPAKIEYASSALGDSWSYALTIGAIPLAACAVLLLLMWVLNARKRSAAVTDEMAETLAETLGVTQPSRAGKRSAPAPYLPAAKQATGSKPPVRRKV